MAAWKDMGPGTKAAVGAIIAILFGLGGYQLFGAKPGAQPGAGTGAETGVGTGTGTEAPKADATTAEAAPQPTPEPAAEASAKAPDAASVPASDPGTGRFDIVRVDPDGQTVVAGQVAPGAKVSILLDGVEIAQATADDAGKFVAMFGLSTGGAGRLMTMTATLADGAVVTVGAGVAIAQTVQAPAAGSETAASEGAAESAGTESGGTEGGGTESAGTETGGTETGGTTALAVTDQGAQVLQSSSEAVTGNVTIDTIAYPSPDAVQFGGKGAPGNLVQLYLDNAALGAPVRIGAEGGWNLTQAGIEPGVHTLRVDELDATGKVVSRYETPFKRETVEALAAAQASGDASAGTEAEGTAAPSAEAGSTAETGATESAGAQMAGTETAGTETAGTEKAGSEKAGADPAAATTAGATDAANTGTAAASTETQSAEQGASTEAPAAQSAEPAAEAPATTADAVAPPAGDAAPETATAEATATEATAPAADPAPGAGGFVSVTVQPGFTLWGIANRELGDGTLYVQVWDANKDKIRDPDLIYPGQVFAIPKE